MIPTFVINIRHARGHADEVYIGRAASARGDGKELTGIAALGHSGYFGNPIAANEKCSMCGAIHSAPGGTLFCYRQYVAKRLTDDKDFAVAVSSLRGKRLVCFCAPRSCHGDVLARVADGGEP